MKIDDIKDGAAAFEQLGGTLNPQTGDAENLGVAMGNLMAANPGMTQPQAQQAIGQMAGAALFAPQIVEKAQDFRLYLRYRF